MIIYAQSTGKTIVTIWLLSVSPICNVIQFLLAEIQKYSFLNCSLSLLFQACMENSGSIFLKVAVAQQSVEPLPVPVEVSTACVLVCVLVSSSFSYVTFVHFETWFFDLFRQQSRMRSGCMQMLRRLQ